jgi:mannose-6-phosphate isomerase-like protein (cupin superfamily)
MRLMFSAGRGLWLLGVLLAGFNNTNASELKEARVTQIVRDVQLLPTAAPPRPAAVDDQVRNGTAVRTGTESRTELKFTDATLARLGANTIFSFTEGTRNLELTDGAMLLRVPKNAGGAKINTAAVTAAITGTTIMLEFHKNSYVKFIVLEGTGRIFVPNRVGESVLVHAGQMLITKPNARNLPSPVDVDIRKLMKTSRLIRGFGKMGSEDLIAETETNQDEERADGDLYETNLAIYGGGTDIILTDLEHIRSSEEQVPQAPSQFGPPETIATPDAYPIGAGAQISTGPPTITSNGITNFGKIYRTTPLDGTRSLWFFRTTRPFDTASGFDVPDHSPFDLNYIAAFKFQDLQLISNPIVSISQGGITKLALIGVGGIVSGPPGGTLSFTGLDSVLLATQNGSIVLDGRISFHSIPNLFFYARGDSVSLKLGSPISGSNNLLLNSEGTLQVDGNVSVANFNAFSQGDFLSGSGFITAHDVTINSIGGNVAFDAGKFPNVAGGTIDLTANGTLSFTPSAGAMTRASIVGRGSTIDLVSSKPFMFDFSNSSMSFMAGNGGIRASNIDFFGSNLLLKSGGDINLLASRVPVAEDGTAILSGDIQAAGSISASGPIEIADLQAGNNINAGSINAGNIQAGGSITSADGIDATGGSISAGHDIISTGLLRLNRDDNDVIGNITAGGNIFAGGGILTSADSIVTAAGDIFAPQAIAGTLTAGGNITIDNSSGLFGAGVLVETINAATISFVNTSRVSSIYFGTGPGAFSPHDFSMTVGSVDSTGPAIPVLFANGLNANSSNPFGAGNGGNVTLNISLDGLVVAPDGDFTSITANGGQFNAAGPFTGGNGGVINITAAGPIVIDAPIEATTGYVQSPNPHGSGGTVNLTSTNNSVAVNSRIEVSSADQPSVKSPRRSAVGGNIGLKSGKPSGVAINLSNTSELLSLLDAAAPGPGGKVTILATGANSSANINGKIAVDRGTIDIRHTGETGQIFLGGPAGSDQLDAHADVIKVAALGNNGVLTVGNGLLSADTTLKLYSPGSNGTVNFVADVTLSGASTKIIAGNTVNIFNGVVVTVGGRTPASVFTNNANYTGFGGNGSRTGTFSGAGAKNPLPLSQAPALDAPGG